MYTLKVPIIKTRAVQSIAIYSARILKGILNAPRPRRADTGCRTDDDDCGDGADVMVIIPSAPVDRLVRRAEVRAPR